MRKYIILAVFLLTLSTWPAKCTEMREEKEYSQLKNNTVGTFEYHATKIKKGLPRIIEVLSLIERFDVFRLTFFFRCIKSILRKIKSYIRWNPFGSYANKIHQNTEVFCYQQITSTKVLFLGASFVEMKRFADN